MDRRAHERGVGMLNTPYVKKDTIKNFFPVPNAVFDLGLHHMEINIYAYLLRIEDRRTYQCIVSYPAIARKLGLTVPLCNNFNGYAPAALTERLLPYFQAYIMDFKYADDALGQRLSAVPAYPAHARANLALLSARYGSNRYDAVGLLQSGVLLRHLILPGQWQNTEDTLRLLAQNNPRGYPLSLLPDFVPEGNTAAVLPPPYTVPPDRLRGFTDLAHSLGLSLL